MLRHENPGHTNLNYCWGSAYRLLVVAAAVKAASASFSSGCRERGAVAIVDKKSGWVQDSGSVSYPGCLRCSDRAGAVVALLKVIETSLVVPFMADLELLQCWRDKGFTVSCSCLKELRRIGRTSCQ